MATKISKDVALKAIDGMETVHCFLGQNPMLFIGADWDHAGVVEAIEREPDEIHIADHPMNHNLAVFIPVSNCYAYFDIPRAKLESLIGT